MELIEVKHRQQQDGQTPCDGLEEEEGGGPCRRFRTQHDGCDGNKQLQHPGCPNCDQNARVVIARGPKVGHPTEEPGQRKENTII